MALTLSSKILVFILLQQTSNLHRLPTSLCSPTSLQILFLCYLPLQQLRLADLVMSRTRTI